MTDTLKDELERTLGVSVASLKRADYARVAEVCRKTPGSCFCGIHITEVGEQQPPQPVLLRWQKEMQRVEHYLDILEASVKSMRISLRCPGPPDVQGGHACLVASANLITALARAEAYERAEKDEGG